MTIHIRKKHRKRSLDSSVEEYVHQSIQDFSSEISTLALNALEENIYAQIRKEINSLPISDENRESVYDAFTVFADPLRLTVTIHFVTYDWLTFALENGVGSFDIKEGLLKSKAKVSKDGYRYRVIPLTNRSRAAPKNSKKDSPFWDNNKHQETIKEAIRKLKYKYQLIEESEKSDAKLHRDVYVRREIFKTPPIKGKPSTVVTERVRKFATKEAFERRQSPITTTFTNFKTVSDNPESESKWQHPGFTGLNVMSKIESLIKAKIPSYYDAAVKEIMEVII